MQKNLFIKIAAVLLLSVMPLMLTACPSPPPCDETISDKQIIQDIVFSNSTIEQLSKELHLSSTYVSDCYIYGKANISLSYTLPTTYSRYGYTYEDALLVSYVKQGGQIGISSIFNQEILPFDSKAILGVFKSRIWDIESSERVREFYTKLDVDTKRPIYLSYNMVMIQSDNHSYFVEYKPYTGDARGYVLPNDTVWLAYPEMGLAHHIIQSKLLVGELAGCLVDKQGVTRVQFHDFDDWFLDVSVMCKDNVRKIAQVQLYPDGSYRRLELKEP